MRIKSDDYLARLDVVVTNENTNTKMMMSFIVVVIVGNDVAFEV